jgi:hypothetical protein
MKISVENRTVNVELQTPIFKQLNKTKFQKFFLTVVYQ